MDHLDEDGADHGFDDELQEIRGAFLNDTIAALEPAEPICLAETATVKDAIGRMLEQRQAGVLIVDDAGRLAGIFTERDVLTRVAGPGRNAERTALHEVMTRNPEALTTEDRIAYAVHSMSVAGFRTVPLIDGDRRPVGVVTVSDVIRWLAHLYPEAVLNLPPGDVLKNPHAIDAG